eukprot:gene33271-43022_t
MIQFTDQDWVDFRLAELHSLLELHGIPFGSPQLKQPVGIESSGSSYELRPEEVLSGYCGSAGNYLLLTLPDDAAAQLLCQRAVLIRTVHRLWAAADSLDDLVDQVRALPSSFLEPLYAEDNSWAVQVDSFCRTLTMEQKKDCRERFRFLQFRGPVDLTHPAVELWVVLDHSRCLAPAPATQGVRCYFGRLLGQGGLRAEQRLYSLKQRLYVGPTSLDQALAFLLANLTKVAAGSLAYDPFVGTASILVALTHFGAICTGSDIDPRVLRGEMKVDLTRRDVLENFHAYGLPRPDLIRMDNHLFDRDTDGDRDGDGDDGREGFFDAIVTDPPYGIRAGAKKSGRKGELRYSIAEERRADHVPAVQPYPVEEVMLDLLHTAATALRCGGVLTYLIPTTYDFTLTDLPLHPCLDLLQVCHQPLSARHGRRAVVMPYSSDHRTSFEAYKQQVLGGQEPELLQFEAEDQQRPPQEEKTGQERLSEGSKEDADAS